MHPHPPLLLTPADCRRVPWRNGMGTTTEIAVEALDDARFLWRVSIADVAAAGPFSNFSGYDRLIAVIDGVGMALTVDGGDPVVRRRMDPAFAFSGDATVDCALLDGAIRDFNLMVNRASATGALDLLTGAARHACVADVTLVHALNGSATVQLDGVQVDGVQVDAGEPIAVPPGHTLLLRGADATIILPEGAETVVATINRRPA